ncbi:MAG: thioredoxin [Chitinophagaceae bacterium]|nr:thioredoxin [Chitinophagaceae bacterium]
MQFDELVQSNTPTLIDFHATWCGPCKAMAPILQETKHALGDSVQIIKIDVDKNPGLAQALGIQGVPTLILYRNGQLLWRQSGVVPKHQLVDIVKKALA